jgi:hypothetical protein
MDATTGLPVFSGPFIRQRHRVKSPPGKANDFPDIGNAQTLRNGKMMNKTYVNVPPREPGHPFAAFFEEHWRDDEAGVYGDGNAVSTFFEHGGWFHYGEYTTYKKDRYAITGHQLAQLASQDPTTKDRWTSFYAGITDSRKDYLKYWGYDPDLPKKSFWDALVARGDEWAIHFSIFVCTGFDEAKIAPWVAQRNSRLAGERDWAASEEGRRVREEWEAKQPKKAPAKKKKAEGTRAKATKRAQESEEGEEEEKPKKRSRKSTG